jgi:hypothetical protein
MEKEFPNTTVEVDLLKSYNGEFGGDFALGLQYKDISELEQVYLD